MDLREKLEKVTSDLIEAKQRLGDAQRRFDEVYKAISGDNDSKSESRKVKKHLKNQDDRKIDMIESILGSEPEKDHHVETIAKEVGTTLGTARVLLYRLKSMAKAKRGKGVGMWRKV